MGPELRQVVQTIMSDLGMGEDQSKIDALSAPDTGPFGLHACNGFEPYFRSVKYDPFFSSPSMRTIGAYMG